MTRHLNIIFVFQIWDMIFESQKWDEIFWNFFNFYAN